MPTHEVYLKGQKYSLEMELRNLDTQRQVSNAEFKTKEQILNRQLDNITRQLETGNK